MSINLFPFSYLTQNNNVNDTENEAFILSLQTKNEMIKICDRPIHSEHGVKKYIIHKYLFTDLSVEKNKEMENLTESYFNAKKSHSELVSKWALDRFETAQEGLEFSIETLRHIDPSLLGESCIDPSDNFIIIILKIIFLFPYYQINRKLTGAPEMQKWMGRLGYFREKIEEEQIISSFQSCFGDLRIPAKQLKSGWKREKMLPTSVTEIQKYLAEDYPEFLTSLPREEADEKIELFLQAKEKFFHIIKMTVCSDPEAIFSFEREEHRMPSAEDDVPTIRDRLAKKYNGKIGEVCSEGFSIETPDKIIYFGDLIAVQIQLSLLQGLNDPYFSTFFYHRFIPKEVESFVVYKEKKSFEIHLKRDHLGHVEKVGEEGYKDVLSAKMSVKKKISYHFDDGIVFDGNPFRMGIILKDFETYLQCATTTKMWMANSYLSSYKESGIALTLNLNKIKKCDDDWYRMFFGVNDHEKIPMDEGIEPDFLLKKELPRVIKFLDFNYSMLYHSFNDLILHSSR